MTMQFSIEEPVHLGPEVVGGEDGQVEVGLHDLRSEEGKSDPRLGRVYAYVHFHNTP